MRAAAFAVAFTTALFALPATPSAAPAIVGDGIPASLTGAPGDAARGRTIVADRAKGLCVLCHQVPIPEVRFQGDLGPSLAGTGSRWSIAALRLRVADARRLNPDTIMPSYLGASGLVRVGAVFREKPILSPAEIEDVVAYLTTLKEP